MAEPTESEIVSPDRPPEAPELPTARKRRPRSIKIGSDAVLAILKNFERDLTDRQARINMRMDRYAKLRGWLPKKDWPWKDCSNFWVPLMMTISLRMKATLENAVKATHPVMQAKARREHDKDKQEKIDQIIDYQLFVENMGEEKIDAFINNFVDDEAAFVMVNWVKDRQTMVEIRVHPALQPEIDPIAQILQYIEQDFPPGVVVAMKDNQGNAWEAEFIDVDTHEAQSANIEIYDRDDGNIELHIKSFSSTFNGPSMEVLDFEDVVFPVRSANLQPPSPQNPLGAAYVNVICTATVDSIERGRESKFYDLVSDEDMENIRNSKSAVNSGTEDQQPKEQKDALEGTQASTAQGRPDRQIIRHYGRMDIDNDGLEEDVVLWIARDTKTLLRARLLSEIHPGKVAIRPIASTSFFPIPNRVYGMSYIECLEPIQDAMQIMMNQHVDWGTITNVPWFAYRAASGVKPEPISIAPGEGLPLDNPQTDLMFPQFPNKDSSFSLNTITVLQQFADNLSMLNAINYGRVPTGKASALRTMGTTQALLSQSDTRSEQVLRRLFYGLAQVFQFFHGLNRRYLPEEKEFRVFGKSETGAGPYTKVRPEDIDGEVDFEFKSTLFNTNKEQLAVQLREAMALLVSPLALQLGIVTPGHIYHLMEDTLKAMDLDEDRYIQEPQGMMEGPKLMAEEAITMILNGQPPVGQPEEPPDQHLKKLMAFMQSDQFGFLDQGKVGIFQAWMMQVQQFAQLMMQQQALMANATKMSGNDAGAEEGPGGVPSTMKAPGMGDNPMVNGGEFIDEAANPGGLAQ